MVAFRHNGVTRRIAAPRVAYALATGAWPPRGGQVRLRTGDADFRPDKLELVPCLEHKPHGKGGSAASLVNRQAADWALLRTMVENPGATVEELGRLTSVIRAKASIRLTKLAKRDLVTSPMCVPGRSWLLTDQGRTVATEGQPMIDALDRDILGVLRSASRGVSRLARRVEVCEFTIKRRARLLAARGLLFADSRKFFEITEAGISALGPSTAPNRWVNVERISAAASREVLGHHGLAVMPNSQRARIGGLARAKQMWRATNAGDAEVEPERMRA
jgi:hypothetical protein